MDPAPSEDPSGGSFLPLPASRGCPVLLVWRASLWSLPLYSPCLPLCAQTTHVVLSGPVHVVLGRHPLSIISSLTSWCSQVLEIRCGLSCGEGGSNHFFAFKDLKITPNIKMWVFHVRILEHGSCCTCPGSVRRGEGLKRENPKVPSSESTDWVFMQVRMWVISASLLNPCTQLLIFSPGLSVPQHFSGCKFVSFFWELSWRMRT